MRIFISCIILLFSMHTLFAQEVVVKQVVGKVEFVVGKKRTIVKNFSTFSDRSGVFVLKDKKAQLFIRIGDKLDLLTFSKNKHKYPLIDLITPKQDAHKKEEGFLDKWFSFFHISHDNGAKIGDMQVADKSGVSRSFNDTNIISIEQIMIVDGYPFKIDFGSFIDSKNKQNKKFQVLIKTKYNNQEIFSSIISETYFSLETENIKKFLVLEWELEINDISSSRKIKGKIKSKTFQSDEKKLLDQLKDKAMLESKTNEFIYQIVFIESLRLSGLLANASYYLDLFIETNNNIKLVEYRNHLTKN
ncbi:MAG: hypothetical protein O2916_11665 [Proteobacteria bacterium]|nr:hypothetical protein [Pseudomonadota bacterium]